MGKDYKLFFSCIRRQSIDVALHEIVDRNGKCFLFQFTGFDI